jgi:hypothetical protein
VPAPYAAYYRFAPEWSVIETPSGVPGVRAPTASR